MRPTDVNGINKAAGEYYHLVYNNVFGVRACSLRLTNVYGPRQLIRHNRQGFIGWFIRLAIEDGTIQIYGDGSQLRDFVYVDDAADAFLRAGASDALQRRGVQRRRRRADQPSRPRRRCSSRIAGAGRVEYVDWPPEKKAIDIGDFYADSSKFTATTGWSADGRRCATGCARTVAFYREHFDALRDRRRPRARSACDRSAPSRSCRWRRARTPTPVRAAIDRVVASGWFVLGPEVEAFEAEFAAASGATHAVGVGTGTDALALILRALGIGPGDEVITHAALGRLHGARDASWPARARCSPTSIPSALTLDPAAVDAAVTPRTRAILPVHLYGQAADMAALAAGRRAPWPGRSSKTAARRTSRPRAGARSAPSASPARSASIRRRTSARSATAARSSPTTRRSPIASGGCATAGRSIATATSEPGVNSRLDELQAAILRARLPLLAGWTAPAASAGRRYRAALAGAPVAVPREADAGHVYHLFVVRAPGPGRRDALQRHLAAAGLETLVHYPVPIPRQPAFAGLAPADCPRAARACDEVLSLPLHPGLGDAEIDRVAGAVCGFEAGGLTRASAHHRRRRLHRIASFRGAARARPPGARPRQPLDRIDRQHRAPEGPPRLRVLHRLGGQRAAARRARSIAATSSFISPPPSA